MCDAEGEQKQSDRVCAVFASADDAKAMAARMMAEAGEEGEIEWWDRDFPIVANHGDYYLEIRHKVIGKVTAYGFVTTGNGRVCALPFSTGKGTNH